MRLKTRIKDTQYAVEVSGEGNTYDVLIDGQSHPVQLIFSDASHDVLLYRNICYDVVLVNQGGRYQVDVRNHFFDVEIEDPRRRSSQTASLGGDGRQVINARMPGRIVKILAAEGEAVAKGGGLLVLEAMKMQNELTAPRAGTVIQVAVREGDTVAIGQTLVVLE